MLPHLVARALEEGDADDPCIFTGDRVLSYGDVRDHTSQMVQVLRSLDLRRGGRLAILSKNRPEVLLNAFATLVNGCILTPLHPMGSLADHAFAVNDAEIDCLVFDTEHFAERAL